MSDEAVVVPNSRAAALVDRTSRRLSSAFYTIFVPQLEWPFGLASDISDRPVSEMSDAAAFLASHCDESPAPPQIRHRSLRNLPEP